MQSASKRCLFIALPLIAACAMKAATATLLVDDPPSPKNPEFYKKLQSALVKFEQSGDPTIQRLHAAVVASPGTINFREMTDDKTTWSSDGDRDRGHTEPTDGRPKREGRSKPVNATIFIPRSAVESGSPRWNSGLLAHELVHALDLTTGRYNRDYTVRERRATFIQNIWRHHVSSPLRTTYHGKFPTMDYQHASKQGTIAEYADYIFTRAYFPKPSAETSPDKFPGNKR